MKMLLCTVRLFTHTCFALQVDMNTGMAYIPMVLRI